MTTEHEASRTLVKSPPELWAECSDAGSLARHLGEFGEIKITRLEPESTVAWEGEHASGTVRIEPSGWGTRVTLTAQMSGLEVGDAAPAGEEPAGPPAGPEPPHVESLLPEAESPTVQEAKDAPVEETLEEADPIPLQPTPRPRARWQRLTTRLRAFFAPVDGAAAKHTANPQPWAVVEPEESLRAPVAEPAQEEPAHEEPAREEPAREEPAREDLPRDEPEAREEPQVQPEPQLQPEPELRGEPEPQSEPEATTAAPELDAEAVLSSALDSLGQAHHRPFSRA